MTDPAAAPPPLMKWRPPLWLVVGGILGVVLCLPIIGIFVVRYMWPVIGYREAVWLAGFGVLAATGALGWTLWRILLRPITELRQRTTDLRTGGDMTKALTPLAHYGTSEMYGLGRSFLDMGRALHSREAVLRGYADHVTHELKSPITVVRGAAELLALDGLPVAERAKLIARIEGAADRMTALLDAQRRLAHAQEPAAPGDAQLAEVVRGMAHCTVMQDGRIPLPADTLTVVLDHLISNALAHGATGVTLSLEGGALVVQDDGTGISSGNSERIFEPFFTTRRAEGGTGMGLSILRRLLDAHGATIALGDSAKGARFVIRFATGA